MTTRTTPPPASGPVHGLPPAGPTAAAAASAASRAARWAAGRSELLTRLLDKVSATPALDAVAGPVRDAVRGLPLGPAARDALRGTWLGHPLHPALVQVPIGAWTSAGLVDLLPHRGRTASLLIAVGLAGAVPAVAAGWLDWSDQRPEQQRVGLVHAASNTTAVLLYACSLRHRLRGHGLRGRVLAFAGLGAAGLGGAIGGHLSYRLAAGANQTAAAPHLVEPGWHRLARWEELPVGRAVRHTVGEVPVLVVRHGGDAPVAADGSAPDGAAPVSVLADRCSHLSGPLSEGTLGRCEEAEDGEDGGAGENGAGGEGGAECVTCPWHGSTFRLTDGAVVRGPATAPQPVFETRLSEGWLLVRAPEGATTGP